MVKIFVESTFDASCHCWLRFFIHAVELQCLSDTGREPCPGALGATYGVLIYNCPLSVPFCFSHPLKLFTQTISLVFPGQGISKACPLFSFFFFGARVKFHESCCLTPSDGIAGGLFAILKHNIKYGSRLLFHKQRV